MSSRTCKLVSGWLNTLTLTVLLSLFLQLAGGGYLVCDIGFQLCDAECYDPKTLACLPSDGKKIVCPKAQKACGSECYSYGRCLHENGVFATCLKDQLQCGEGCFDPSIEKCINGTLVCEIEQEACGTGDKMQCFKPSKAKCTPQGRVCRTGQASCGHVCYKPRTGTKCFNDTVLCHGGRKPCGRGRRRPGECFLEAWNETCVNDTAVCKVGEVLCGKRTCYDPTDTTIKCNLHAGVVCPVGHEICGSRCFDPDAYACFPYKGFANLCPTGQKGCGGTDCFTPGEAAAEDGHVYECLTNADGLEVLCRSGQLQCGSICFTPEVKADDGDVEGVSSSVAYKCAKSEDGQEILCRSSEEVCGDTCFDPKTQVCHTTPESEDDSSPEEEIV